MRARNWLVMCVIVSGTLGACSSDQSIEVVLRVVTGPSGDTTARSVAPNYSPRVTDGSWWVTPNQVRLTLVGIDWMPAEVGPPPLQGCTVTYDSSLPPLSTLLDCPFELGPYPYTSVRVNLAPEIEMLIDDSTNGLYTDPASPTLLSSTPPPGGAQFVSLVMQGAGVDPWVGGLRHAFSPSFQAAEEETPLLSVALHGIHLTRVSVTDGVPQFSDGETVRPPVWLFPIVGEFGRAAYYTDADTTGTQLAATTGLAVFYDSSEPVTVRGAVDSEPPFRCPPVFHPDGNFVTSSFTVVEFGGGDFQYGGSLGRDASGTLCWGQPDDELSLEPSGTMVHMPELSVLGEMTTMTCQEIDGPLPTPSEGQTFASGCPSITPSDQQVLYLRSN